MFDPLIVDALGRTADGQEIARFSLRTADGLRADVMNYGATLMRLEAPDRAGKSANIVLGFDTLAPYLAGTPGFGATIGRFANRIAGARFALDGRSYQLAANEGANHLHGGVRGFDKVVWGAERFTLVGAPGVAMRYVSADGEEGYPGELTVETTYVLEPGKLRISFRAETNAPTHVNLTHHSYFDLSAAGRGADAHDLQINADAFLEVDASLIPQAMRAAAGTPFDFRTPHKIGSREDVADAQLQRAGGYDHTFLLNKPTPGAMAEAAVLSEANSGRRLTLSTTAPGLQLYTGGNLDGSVGGFGRRAGVCLEPQHFPDTPNRPDFPSTILRPGQTYEARIELAFGVLS